MKKSIIICALVPMLIASGCSNEPIVINPTPGNIEINGDERVTVLHLSAGENVAWSQEVDAEFKIIDPVNRNTFTFGGNIKFDRDMNVLGSMGAATCRISIGLTDIPDGDYFISVTGDNLPDLGPRLVKFAGNVGAEQQNNPIDYEDLSGDGTAQNPYLINDAGDFLTLQYYLLDDPTHACGRFFRQTASFELPRRSMIIDGRVWLPVTFSGHYDGGGFELKSLIYQGAENKESDSDVGMFKELYSATVENVTFTDAMIINAHSNVGLVAGSASGSCVFSNISIGGTIDAIGDNIGGVIGLNCGSGTFSNIRINSLFISSSESQGQSVGGLIGSATGESLNVSGVSIPDHIFSIKGHSRVGGIAGNTEVKSVSFDNITLEHSVDQESSDIKVIYGSDMYTGGIAGFIKADESLAFNHISIKCPVRGHKEVGALSGHALTPKTATIENTVISSVVSGDQSIGGFFGYFSLTGSGATLNFLGADNTNRYVVKSSAAATVEGTDANVGGLIGYLEGSGAKIIVNGKVEIAVDVKGNSEVGGAFGYIKDISKLDVSRFNFSSHEMHVKGNENVGGIIGKASGTTITGLIAYDLYQGIPTADKLQSCFSGVVEGSVNVGGISGYYQGTMAGVGSDAIVTATTDVAGGICGYFDGMIDRCAFWGNVNCNKVVSGVIGKCEGELTMYSCLNLANITNGTYQGGIIGYMSISEIPMVTIKGCFNSGDLTNGCIAGGIIAYAYRTYPPSPNDSSYTLIQDCGNNGTIKAKGGSKDPIGGLFGKLAMDQIYVEHCANQGEVTSQNSQFAVAGVIGELGTADWNRNYAARITQCMNAGKISAGFHTHVGGVVGYLRSGINYNATTKGTQVYDCYNIGNIAPDVEDDTGGIVGITESYSDTFRNFNRGDIRDGNAIIGTHTSSSLFSHSDNYYLDGKGDGWPSSTKVSQKDLGKESTYHNFNFKSIWQITSDGPILRNCPFQDSKFKK